ncbi:indolepyruvate ferredoxin oxidoreductase [Sulfitobacter indolifex HEL-45]|uniref:Indolepyruvate ferredoxin oxidoreductase n=1 Tax=Sulfitobacter indolifex HEL-45 TaxID=391624 RepID=A0ABP2D3K6_9RHOB|nr:indolepyruvate ferredoxin oxidoreductase [Sulfitobacter indolifex HEL-45]
MLIAAEMMEVGRAVMRGFVTPDRTTLIGSTHRALAVSEKMAPGDGIADADEVRAAAEIAAQKLVLEDMEGLAVGAGSVISASLFGALAGSGALPFRREAYEDAIRAGGKGVEPSLRAFAVGYDAAQGHLPTASPVTTDEFETPFRLTGPQALQSHWDGLVTRADALPEAVHDLAFAGLSKVVNFQDCAYGTLYLNRLDTVLARDSAACDWRLSAEAAKYIANAMAYDDIIRVADLKTRAPRFTHIRQEMRAGDANLMQLTEYFHPRAEEIAGLMPARLGAKVEASDTWMARLNRWFDKGRRLRTDRLPAFLMLHVLGGLKGYRLKTHRHAIEMAHLDDWLARSLAEVDADYDVAVELVKCRRLIKGYSDTHARGLGKFDKVMDAADLLRGRDDAAQWIARLREAALQDAEGKALDGAIATVRSFV